MFDSSAVQFTTTVDRVRQKFSSVDLIVVDLDQCIFPGYSQVYLGALIALKILLNPEVPKDRRLLPSLISGGMFITSSKIKATFGIPTPNSTMMQHYETAMQGIPKSYFYWAAEKVPGKSYAYSLETIALLAAKAPVGIISLGTDIVLKAYQEHSTFTRTRAISFYNANTLLFGENHGRPVFTAYARDGMMWNGAQKRKALAQRIAQFKVSCPLVIGHNADDYLMAQCAREAGGLSIGYNPDNTMAPHCDVMVRAKSWLPLLSLIKTCMLKQPE